MKRLWLLLPIAALVVTGAALALFGQVRNFKPVTQQMLENPSPNDWLMFSRTYDAQRFSRRPAPPSVGRTLGA